MAQWLEHRPRIKGSQVRFLVKGVDLGCRFNPAPQLGHVLEATSPCVSLTLTCPAPSAPSTPSLPLSQNQREKHPQARMAWSPSSALCTSLPLSTFLSVSGLRCKCLPTGNRSGGKSKPYSLRGKETLSKVCRCPFYPRNKAVLLPACPLFCSFSSYVFSVFNMPGPVPGARDSETQEGSSLGLQPRWEDIRH